MCQICRAFAIYASFSLSLSSSIFFSLPTLLPFLHIVPRPECSFFPVVHSKLPSEMRLMMMIIIIIVIAVVYLAFAEGEHCPNIRPSRLNYHL